jgi:glucose/arabinose dehydrogenase
MWHYGGELSWGPEQPEAMLYLGVGDKYTEMNAALPNHHTGCIIRIARDGTIPAGNLPVHIKPAACWA